MALQTMSGKWKNNVWTPTKKDEPLQPSAPTKITEAWTTSSGKSVELTAELKTSKEIDLDGYKDTVPDLRIETMVKVNGKPISGVLDSMSEAQKKAYPGYTNKYGSLALTPDQAAKIRNARKALEQHPLWQQKEALAAKNQKEIKEYEDKLKGIKGGMYDTTTY